jgi:acetylornithine aminotransferase
MTNKENYISQYNDNLLGVFGEPQIVIESGSGCYVTDVDGNKYLDMLGGIAVNSLGYSHPKIASTIKNQAEKIQHVSNFFTTKETINLAEKLVNYVSGGSDKINPLVFFTNSGTESNEAALKIVKKNGAQLAEKTQQNNYKIIALKNSFHGRSTGALALTYKSKYRDPFNPLIPNIEFIEPSIESLTEAFKTADSSGVPIAGLFLETIQGEGGVLPISPDFLWEARKVCTEKNSLLVVDEVQTGVSRTGTFFSYQHPYFEKSGHIVPDIITMAKGLGGGFPIGAMIAVTPESQILHIAEHGTTFGGNPMACAVAGAVIDVIENENLAENATAMGEYLDERMLSVFGVKTRGLGLLRAFDTNTFKETDAAKIVQLLQSDVVKNKIIVNAVGPNTIRLAPPLIISKTEIDIFIESLKF